MTSAYAYMMGLCHGVVVVSLLFYFLFGRRRSSQSAESQS